MTLKRSRPSNEQDRLVEGLDEGTKSIVSILAIVRRLSLQHVTFLVGSSAAPLYSQQQSCGRAHRKDSTLRRNSLHDGLIRAGSDVVEGGVIGRCERPTVQERRSDDPLRYAPV